MLSTDFFNQSLNSTLIEALMVSTSNYEMRDSLFLGIDASFNLKFRIAVFCCSFTITFALPSAFLMRQVASVFENSEGLFFHFFTACCRFRAVCPRISEKDWGIMLPL